MKVTERTLVDMCRRINNEQLKHWDSGLKVERCEAYVVHRLYRKPQIGRPGCLDLFYGSPREVKAFIEGFARAAELANEGAASGSKAFNVGFLEQQAKSCRLVQENLNKQLSRLEIYV
jgi:hypothetical protein